ncbi:MAG: serine hydrolase domain-containing protein [Mycobacteriales bacterium]
MASNELAEFLSATATELTVPGAAAAVLLDGEERVAVHGVTSVENPLPVDEDTLFQFGSTGKTYTATAMLRLVEQGRVDLDAPVRTYVPEFALADEEAAATVTVAQLFNHTAGWQGDLMDDTGDGDDALERYVALMVKLEQVTPPGAAVSYNNASLSLAGRILEKVLGTSYEQAIRDLVLDPLDLTNTFFFANEIITRRFTVGHRQHEDGRVTVARPWALPRAGNPAGGMSASVRDQLAWARFHLGDGTAPDGTRLLERATLERMREPTADMRGSALGDHVGISWLLRDVGGVRIVGHGGTTIGQHSEFTMVPERGFALVSLTNSGPGGADLNRTLEKWALEHYLGIREPQPTTVHLDAAALAAYAGRYETIAAVCDVAAGDGQLVVTVTIKPETAAALAEAGEEVPDQPPIPIALLGGADDRFVVPDGPGTGMTGYFTRDTSGRVDGVHLGGRLARRTADLSA